MLRRNAIAALALLPPVSRAQQSHETAKEGRWRGDARLFNAKLRAKTGKIPAELLFESDGTVSGRVGDATIPATRPKTTNSSRVEYQVVVSGQVHEALNHDLNHMIILVSITPGAELDADFHLKKRFGFDPAILVGHFDVKRAN